MGDLIDKNFTSDLEMDFDKLDSLPYGAILIDAEGTIIFYNRQEESNAGMARAEVLGKNFFTEVAPCAQIREFYDQFKTVVGKLGVIATFRFHFPIPGRPRDVKITLTSFEHAGQLLCLIVAGNAEE